MTDALAIAQIREAAAREAKSGANAGFQTLDRERAFTRADTLWAIADWLEGKRK